jgi:D-Tyr-tRNAtyr deacylase
MIIHINILWFRVRKILNYRIFPDEQGPWKRSVLELGLEILSGNNDDA